MRVAFVHRSYQLASCETVERELSMTIIGHRAHLRVFHLFSRAHITIRHYTAALKYANVVLIKLRVVTAAHIAPD